MKDLIIYVYPISGGAFVNQIGLTIEVSKAKDLIEMNRNPDVMLGNSGGNVTSYIAMAGDFTEEGIMRFVRGLNSTLFARLWPRNIFIPSVCIGLLKGSLYKQGCGANKLFHSAFNQKTIQDIEIWTGTYCIDDRKAQLFCNKCKEDSLLESKSLPFYDILPGIYMKGNIDYISDVSLASASIPIIVPPVTICNKRYSDGGVMYSSPLTPLKNDIIEKINSNKTCNKGLTYNIINDEIREITNNMFEESTIYNIDDNRINKLSEQRKLNSKYVILEKEERDLLEKRRLRLFYFNSYNIDCYKEGLECTSLEEAKKAVEQMIHMGCLADNRTAIDILKELCCGNISESYIEKMNFTLLSKVLEKIDKHEHYVVILTPEQDICIDITNFQGERIMKDIEKSRINYSVRLFVSN